MRSRLVQKEGEIEAHTEESVIVLASVYLTIVFVRQTHRCNRNLYPVQLMKHVEW